MAVAQKSKSIVGTSVTRLDVNEKVTGATVYTDDIQFGAGLLHCRVKRSPHPHALIKKIDFSQALKLPGVKGVITGEDYPEFIGLYLKDRNLMARDRVRFVGEAVAAVVASTEEIAERAVDLVDVEYELLTPVLDPEYGATKEAPIIHPDLDKYEHPNFVFPVDGTNIANHFKIRKGDTEAAWPQCAAIVEHTFRIPQVQHVPIEPHVAIAKAEDNGQITLWASTQSPFAQRGLLAKSLHIPESDFRVIAPMIGGGFGC